MAFFYLFIYCWLRSFVPQFVPKPTRVFPLILKSINARKKLKSSVPVLQIFRDKHIKDTEQRKLLQHELTELLHRWYTAFFELTESG